MTAARSSLLTVCSVALVAYASCDMIHEVMGHGVACAITPGVRAISISTVALQTSGESPLVAAAGSVANVIAGVLCFALFRRGRGFDATRYFLWLLATLNLMNGTGYLFFSGLLDYGDWAVVIAGLEPHWMWRAIIGAVGIVAYWGVVRFSAAQMATVVRAALVNRRDVRGLIFPAYLAGGLLLLAGAALNPISPQLILLSGASSGFAAMSGLLAIPRLVEGDTEDSSGHVPALGMRRGWLVLGIMTAVVFVAFLGPGIPLSHR
jgi:hypothetical protein